MWMLPSGFDITGFCVKIARIPPRRYLDNYGNQIDDDKEAVLESQSSPKQLRIN